MAESIEDFRTGLIMASAPELLTHRTGGLLLVLGAVVMFVGAAIPFLTDLGGEAWTGTPREVLSAVSREPGLWWWANGLIALASLITVWGLAGATRLFWSGHPFALAGLATFIVAAVLDIAGRLLNMRVTPWAASQEEPGVPAIFEGLYQLSESLVHGFIWIGFVGLALYGLAALQLGPRDDLRLLPEPRALARVPYYRFHALGIEQHRAELVKRIADRATALQRAADMTGPEALAHLQKLRGIGPWTAAVVVGGPLGYADAVPVGDYHLKNTVAFNLAGEPRADDARMLELLAPYAGHRGRVVRMIKAGGRGAPRYGPRTEVIDIRKR